jgi:hypothetical protein
MKKRRFQINNRFAACYSGVTWRAEFFALIIKEIDQPIGKIIK